MLNFWRSIFYSPLLDPIFVKVASLLNVSKQVCKEYCTSGVMMYGMQFTLIFLFAVAAFLVVKYMGILNPGNSSKFDPDKMNKASGSPLKGKNFIFLGSSVTKGFSAYGKSFVDMIAFHNDANCVKEAVSGTTLVDNGEKSYISRLKKIDKNTKCDVFICQLSTNDATKNSPLGRMIGGTDLSSFDTKTVCGAIEYVIAYAKATWSCPVVFYTSPEYASPVYKDMVDALDGIAKKWDVQVIDLWNDKEINEKENKKRSNMNDSIHPTKKGYQLWTPVFEAALANVVAGKAIAARPAVKPAAATQELAAKRNRKKIKRIAFEVLTVVLAVLIVIGGSTVQQLVSVTGMKNEGNSDVYNPEVQPANADSPIQGKTLLWIGSSVFQGFGSRQTSPAVFVDVIDGTTSVVDVMGGTFLASIDGEVGGGAGGSIAASTSYTNRLMMHDATTDPVVDLVIIQLSTNDSKGQCETGEVISSFDFDDFDLLTTTGSLEAITAYAKETWGARVLVITGTQFQDEMTYSGGQNAGIYQLMIQRCHEIEEKWGGDFTVLDLWHNDEMYASVTTGDSLWRSYMSDAIHPTKKGYLLWWGPYIEATLFEMLG